MLKAGADVDILDSWGGTALHWAMYSNGTAMVAEPDVFAQLLEAGADPTVRTNLGETATQKARADPVFTKVIDEAEIGYVMARARYLLHRGIRTDL
eukprot:49423-Eustigmatos_ZCMA.PRE.1